MDEQHPGAGVIVIAGYGPSIGQSTAIQFGTKGYTVVILGRTKSKLDAGIQYLHSMGIQRVFRFIVDCSQSDVIKGIIQKIQSTIGNIHIIVWNATSYTGKDFMSIENDPNVMLNEIVNVGCAGLLACVQVSYHNLKTNQGTILVTGGGLSAYNTQVDEIAVNNDWMGLAFCKASQRKLTGLLHARLKNDNIKVATVIISGRVGTEEDATDPNQVAEKFWEIHKTKNLENGPEIHLGSLQLLASRKTG